MNQREPKTKANTTKFKKKKKNVEMREKNQRPRERFIEHTHGISA